MDLAGGESARTNQTTKLLHLSIYVSVRLCSHSFDGSSRMTKIVARIGCLLKEEFAVCSL